MLKRCCMLLFVAAAMALGGCAGMGGGDASSGAQASVFAMKGTLDAAIPVATAYVRLPICSATVKAPCSDDAVVKQLQKAIPVARTSLDAAESAVRTPSFGKDVASSALAAASSAIRALTSIVATLGVTK